jgi:hypothetical protein
MKGVYYRSCESIHMERAFSRKDAEHNSRLPMASSNRVAPAGISLSQTGRGAPLTISQEVYQLGGFRIFRERELAD